MTHEFEFCVLKKWKQNISGTTLMAIQVMIWNGISVSESLKALDQTF